MCLCALCLCVHPCLSCGALVCVQARGQVLGLTGLLGHLFLMRIVTETSVHFCLSHLVDALLAGGVAAGVRSSVQLGSVSASDSASGSPLTVLPPVLSNSPRPALLQSPAASAVSTSPSTSPGAATGTNATTSAAVSSSAASSSSSAATTAVLAAPTPAVPPAVPAAASAAVLSGGANAGAVVGVGAAGSGPAQVSPSAMVAALEPRLDPMAQWQVVADATLQLLTIAGTFHLCVQGARRPAVPRCPTPLCGCAQLVPCETWLGRRASLHRCVPGQLVPSIQASCGRLLLCDGSAE